MRHRFAGCPLYPVTCPLLFVFALVEERQTRPAQNREAIQAVGVRIPPGALWHIGRRSPSDHRRWWNVPVEERQTRPVESREAARQ